MSLFYSPLYSRLFNSPWVSKYLYLPLIPTLLSQTSLFPRCPYSRLVCCVIKSQLSRSPVRGLAPPTTHLTLDGEGK